MKKRNGKLELYKLGITLIQNKSNLDVFATKVT